MKFVRTLLPTLVALAFFFNACQSQEKQTKSEETQSAVETSFDIDAEKKKLKEIVILEAQLFIEGKSNQHLFWNSPKTQVVQKTIFSDESFWSLGGEVKAVGGLPHLESNQNFVFEVTDRTDYVIEITDDMAYMTYRQYVNWQDSPDAEKLTGYSHETRVFVKENGEWKIALATSIY